MSQQYQVIWMPVAQRDLRSVISRIADDNPHTALKIASKIHSKAALLYRFPLRCRRIPELKNMPDLSFRELIISPWRLMYRIHKKRVEILAFFDGRQDLHEILFERLSRS